MATKGGASNGCATIGGWLILGGAIFGIATCVGNQHGWDRHSYPISVPFWSGPSYKEIREKLKESGWTNIEDIDRLPPVESTGDHKTRKGTQLYPVRLKTKMLDANPALTTINLYFYRDDFGELRWYMDERE
jgi:hypothetical protein